MASFEIHGGKPLKGELTPQGAKNEALQVLCAPLLTAEKVTIQIFRTSLMLINSLRSCRLWV